MAEPERLPPGFFPVVLSLGLPIALVLFAWFSVGGHGLLNGESKPQQRGEAWLKNLHRVEGFRLREYLGTQTHWELQAPLATVRLQRYVFGRLRTRPMLHLVQPRASLSGTGGAATVTAQRAYYDSRAETWTFVNGLLSQGRGRRRFAELYWTPASAHLEWRTRRPRLPVLRFWQPLH